MKNTKNVSGSREKLTFENKHKSLFFMYRGKSLKFYGCNNIK